MPASPTELLSPALLARLERLELVTRKVFRGRMKGERKSKRKGESVEFADFRNYVPGDDLRHVDWNLYARLDKLFLKLFMEEEDLHFYALIDASNSMDFGTPTKLEFAKRLAAALGYIGLCRADRVRIETISSNPRSNSPVLRGRKSLWRMAEYLQGIEAGDNTPLADGVRNFMLRNTGRGIVVLISDLMDKRGYESAIRALIAQQMDVYVFHVLSEEETNPAIVGDLRLVDCEDSHETEITVSRALLSKYQRTLGGFIEGARQFCSRRGVVYLNMVARQPASGQADPVEEFVGKYLRSRGLVR